MDINDIAANLEMDVAGVWVPPIRRAVSYPEQNSAICYEIEDGSFWYRHRNACIIAAVKKHMRQGPLFDVGGGNGVVSEALQAAGIDVCLLEPNPTAVKNAQQRGVAPLVCAAFEDCRFADNAIPAIGLFDTLEHIEHDMDFLAQIHAALAAGGKLFITVPAYTALWSAHDAQVGHFRRYALAGLCRQLRQLGFQVEYATYLFGFLPVPIWLCRVVPGWFGIRDNGPARKRNEHRAGWPGIATIVNYLLQHELARIRAGQALAFGSSCMVVASKA